MHRLRFCASFAISMQQRGEGLPTYQCRSRQLADGFVDLQQRSRPARDRLADVVVILPDRLDQVLARADARRPEGVPALAAVPAVVATLLDQVDFFPEVLAHVRRPELARLAVEGHPPDVAEPVSP